MLMLFFGLLLWSAVHFIPALAPARRQAWIGAVGEGGYKGLFSLAVLLSIFLMVLGWRSGIGSVLYYPTTGMSKMTPPLMLLAYILMISSLLPTRLRSTIRHPQLKAVQLWAFSHLVSNGEDRSVLLFGGIWIWALLEIWLINRREGEWQKPEIGGVSADVIAVVAGVVLYGVTLVYLHGYISGIPLI